MINERFFHLRRRLEEILIESLYLDTKTASVKQSSSISNVQELSIYFIDIDELIALEHNYYLRKNKLAFFIAIIKWFFYKNNIKTQPK